MAKHVLGIAVGAAVLSLTLAACGSGGEGAERAASLTRCVKMFSQVTSEGTEVLDTCSCVIKRLDEEGMRITDTLKSGTDKGQAIVRKCAAENGLEISGPGGADG